MRLRMGICALAAALLLSALAGCSSGGGADMSAEQRLAQAQSGLESVTTNLTMDPDTAATTLRAAARDFAAVLQSDAQNTRAKFGYALSNTLIGFFDLTSVMPKNMKAPLLQTITAARSRGVFPDAADSLALLATTALADGRGRGAVRDVQLRIASRTLDSAKIALPYYEQLAAAADSGATLSLRLYEGGRIRTVTFGKADIQLLGAGAHFVTALLHAAVAFNLDMPGGTMLRPLPVDSNNNGLLESNEYLIGYPFLERSNGAYLTQFLHYLRQACDLAMVGADMPGHATGPHAFLDVSNPDTVAMLDRLDDYATAISVASSASVSTNAIFGDRITRTIALAKLGQITDLRALLPTFQKHDLTAPGIWPDPTFNGAITPGIPQGVFTLYYADLEGAY